MIQIKVERRVSYDNKVEINIELDEALSSKDYATVMTAIDTIKGVVDPILDLVPPKKEEEDE